MKRYFRQALLRKFPRRPPRRLPRQLHPEKIQERYQIAITEYLKFARGRVDKLVKPLIPGLLAHYKRTRSDADDEPRKYYTAFIYTNSWKEAKVLHCTHKYLGAMDSAAVKRAEKVIDRYFLKPRVLPFVEFSVPAMFGENHDIPVLVPRDPKLDDFFPDLRIDLDLLVSGGFAFKPHVTTSAVKVDRPFAYYALISKAGIHRTWPSTTHIDAEEDNAGDVDLAAVINAPNSLMDLADELKQARIEIDQAYTPSELKRLAEITGRSVAEWNAAQMSGQLHGIVEIDLFGREPWLAREMGAFVVQNVGLIESIPDQYLHQVEQLVATSVRSGRTYQEIADAIDDRYDVSESRARLIARDQVGKFNGQLTELRQKDLGIEGYIRRGVGDARERDSHLLLNNERFTWDDPPEVGHPGDDFECRCWAEPDLASFYESDDNTP